MPKQSSLRHGCLRSSAAALLAFTLALSGCQATPLVSAEPITMQQGSLPATPPQPPPPPAPVEGWVAAAEDDLAAGRPAQRLIVYTANFQVVVLDLEQARAALQTLAQQSGGYVQRIQGDTVTLRVPAAEFDAAVAEVERLGPVTQRELQADDITEEFVDLEARLSNALKVRQRLEALLARAENVQAAVAVENELRRLGEEIERLEARLELLRNRAAYSTITVQLIRVARQTDLIRGYQQLPFAWLHELDPNRLWAH